MTTLNFSPLKLHLGYKEQLSLLKERGLVVADDAGAVATLQRLNYYRLSGYWYPFRKTKPKGERGRFDGFQPDTTLDVIVALYEFDRHLRLLVMSAVERIEVGLRIDIAHQLGARHRRAHEVPALLDGNFTGKVIDRKTGKTAYDEWCDKFCKSIAKSKTEFVKHHVDYYGGHLPIWVAVELWEFGQLSKFFQGMKASDQNHIATRYGLPHGKILASWLRTLNFLRNVSAHHARLWNGNITAVPSFPDCQPHHHLHHVKQHEMAKVRAYGPLAIIQYMLRRISPDDRWGEKLKALSQQFPVSKVVSLYDAGFPEGWEQKSLWK